MREQISGSPAATALRALELPARIVDPIVGAVSLVCWFAALYCGRMLPYLGTGDSKPVEVTSTSVPRALPPLNART